MQKNIFSKLDMKDTTFFPEKRDGYLDRKMNHATRNPQTGALMPGGGHHLLGLPAQDCIGGMGLYSTPEDIVKLLKVMLCGDGSIIKRESVAEMLKPQLDDVTQAAFMEVIDGKAKYHLRQTWPEGHDGTFGLSASINLQDFSGRRLKNSMNWAGSSGLHAVSPASFQSFPFVTKWLTLSAVDRPDLRHRWSHHHPARATGRQDVHAVPVGSGDGVVYGVAGEQTHRLAIECVDCTIRARTLAFDIMCVICAVILTLDALLSHSPIFLYSFNNLLLRVALVKVRNIHPEIRSADEFRRCCLKETVLSLQRGGSLW